ncbi:MAG TPA: GNAT family N-acetyltransferase [Steroidobacteraceae bacterium]|jgi:predicted GNAT family acetyltransferase
MHVLDRPAWASLNTYHERLSTGGSLARRYAADVNVFAATVDDSAAASAALAELIGPSEQLVLVQSAKILIHPKLAAVKQARVVQMMAARGCARIPSAEILKMTEQDGEDMLALAKLTEPGPFLSRTHLMGSFIGVRIGGRLAAMAGERFRTPGYTEVSGVCTHPDFRGRGLARMLSAAVAEGIERRGDVPFLHAWTSNRAAIDLYESLGFEIRAELELTVVAAA